MPKQTLKAIVKGGQASAAPPLGPALGPMGLNIGQVVADINSKTADLKGIDVPITLTVDTDTKKYEIEVGMPPTAALIKKELNLQKGSGKAGSEIIADAPIDVVIKIAKTKRSSLLSKDLKAAVKEVVGTCKAAGITIEGKDGKEVQKEINAGKYDDKISGRVALKEISKEELEAKKRKLASENAAKQAAEVKEEPKGESPKEEQAE